MTAGNVVAGALVGLGAWKVAELGVLGYARFVRWYLRRHSHRWFR